MKHSLSRLQSLPARAALVALALALGSATLAAAAAPPAPEPAHGLPGDLLVGPAAGDQTDPAIAPGGSGFLAVWADARSSLGDASGDGGTGRDIYAARLDADGQLIDSTPLVLTHAFADQYDPRAVWNGSAWLVLWTGTEPYAQYERHFVEGVRVAADGTLLDAAPMLLWDEGGVEDDFRGAASDGSDWALVFQQTYIQGLGTKERLVGKRVTGVGAILNAPSYLYSPSCCSFFWHTGMAYANGVYLVVFEGYFDSWNYGIYGLRLNGNLQTLDSYPLEMVGTSWADDLYYSNPDVASNGSEFYVTWQHWNYGDDSSQVLGARISTAGSSLDGDGVAISNTLAHKFDDSPLVAWDGGQWVVGWPEGETRLARVAADGSVRDPGGVAFPTLPSPALAEADGGLQALWSENRGGGATPYDVFSARVNADLSLGADACVGLAAPAQRGASLAQGDQTALLVFLSELSGDSRVKAQLLDLRGNALMGEPMEIAQDAVGPPAVAFDGTRFLVAWGDAESGEVRALRVGADGAPLDGTPIGLFPGRDPAVSGMDGLFLVSAAGAAGAVATRVDGAGGDLLDAPPLVLENAATAHVSVGALGGDYWLAAWETLGQQDGSEIHGALVAPAGTVAGPLPITPSGDGIAPLRPAVASGDTALVLWQDPRAGADNLDLYGRRLAAAGLTFLDGAGVQLTDVAGSQTDGHAAWDGQRFVTAFSDDRGQVNHLDGRLQVYRGWVAATGEPVEAPEGLPVLGSAQATTLDPAIAADAAGNTVYLASVFDASAATAYRLQLRYAGESTGVEDLPAARRQLAVYPNPANPSVQIRFALPAATRPSVGIYDLRGARVATLDPGVLPAGSQELHWDGRSDGGRELPSGIYFVRLRAAGVDETAKLTLLR
ncbi:MAG: FlgD immunoglobulin-like domain containing protein [Candidatus Krumholzibacteriia bacterium]